MLTFFLACQSNAELENHLMVLEEELAITQERLSVVESTNQELMTEVNQLKERLDEATAKQPSKDNATQTIDARCTESADGHQLPRTVMDNFEHLAATFRVVPHLDTDGNPDGYRFSGIRRNSLISSCGFKNGDVLNAVNGIQLTSIQRSMEVYNDSLSSTSLELAITRRGEPVTLRILLTE